MILEGKLDDIGVLKKQLAVTAKVVLVACVCDVCDVCVCFFGCLCVCVCPMCYVRTMQFQSGSLSLLCLCRAVLCYAVLCCAVLCCAVLCCAVLCCAVLCCAVLCCAVLCCAVLCCTVCACVCCACAVVVTCCYRLNALFCPCQNCAALRKEAEDLRHEVECPDDDDDGVVSSHRCGVFGSCGVACGDKRVEPLPDQNRDGGREAGGQAVVKSWSLLLCSSQHRSFFLRTNFCVIKCKLCKQR
jgi:hypothetical protein